MAQNNPFADAFKSFSEQIPSVDFSEWSAIARRNAEAVAAANQAIAEGLQAIAQRQLEIAQNNAENALEIFKALVSSKDPREAASKQAEAAKKNFEKAASDANEIVQIASKSGNQAYEIIGKQVSDSIKELSKVAASAASSASSSQKKKAAA